MLLIFDPASNLKSGCHGSLAVSCHVHNALMARFADCVWHDFRNNNSPVLYVAPDTNTDIDQYGSQLLYDTSCLADRCEFHDNVETALPSAQKGLVLGDSWAHIGLRNCTFTGSPGPWVGIVAPYHYTFVYANPLLPVHVYDDGKFLPPHPPRESWMKSHMMREAPSYMQHKRTSTPFVNLTTPAFLNLQKVRPCCNIWTQCMS